MEDVEFLRLLRRRGRWRRISAPLLTHPRRFEREGALRAWLRNACLILLFRVGVSPGRLAPFYPPEEGPPLPSLLLFAREPVPGRVKTRLAAGIGEAEAARIYYYLARKVADQVRGGPYRTVVYFDPPGALNEVKKWLGRRDLQFTPQGEGDLGDRLGAAIEKELEESPAVVVVGTDTPGVDRELVTEALERLGGAEVVLGPAEDGGYYLIGMKAPHPKLFQGIPWSTGGVLAATLSRARELGLRTSLLRTLQDVDTVQDWERLGIKEYR
jgi:rSAM/selenodomain-associated transferase 1